MASFEVTTEGMGIAYRSNDVDVVRVGEFQNEPCDVGHVLLKVGDSLLAGSCFVRSCRCVPPPTVLV
jgi:hypothetical protein